MAFWISRSLIHHKLGSNPPPVELESWDECYSGLLYANISHRYKPSIHFLTSFMSWFKDSHSFYFHCHSYSNRSTSFFSCLRLLFPNCIQLLSFAIAAAKLHIRFFSTKFTLLLLHNGATFRIALGKLKIFTHKSSLKTMRNEDQFCSDKLSVNYRPDLRPSFAGLFVTIVFVEHLRTCCL